MEKEIPPEIEVSVHEYLKKWSDRSGKIIGGILAIVITVGGFSVYSIVKNIAHTAVSEQLEQEEWNLKALDTLRKEALESIVETKYLSGDLKTKQKRALDTIDQSEDAAFKLKEKSGNLLAGIKDAEVLLSAVKDLEGVNDSLLSSLLTNASFKASLEERVIAEIAPLPVGTVISWDPIIRHNDGSSTGQTRVVPQEWNFCNGTNGTPDLSDKFIRGTTAIREVGTTGGSLNIASAGEHSHSGTTQSTRGPDHGVPCSGNCS